MKKILSEVARKVVDAYSETYGKFAVLPVKISFAGKYYHYLHFFSADKYLVIDEDGSVPSFEYVKPIIKIAATCVGLNRSFITVGMQWAYSPTIFIYKNVLRFLSYVQWSMGARLDQKLSESLLDFKETAQLMIEEQRKIKRVYREAKKLLKQIYDRTKVVSEEELKVLSELKRQLVECGYKQNMKQIETANERNRLINHLPSRIPFYRLDLWIAWFKLERYNQKMLSVLELTNEEHEEIKKQISGQLTKASLKALEDILATTLNPREAEEVW